MFLRFILPAMLVLASPLTSLAEELMARQQPRSPNKEQTGKARVNRALANSPDRAVVESRDRLRKPGFVFVELFTQDLPGYIDFFNTVAGFKLIRKEGTFVQLQSERAEILLNSTKNLPMGHPCPDKVSRNGRVVVIEIGVVVANLDRAYVAARKFKGWTITDGIARQPWGSRDFRVLSPDGYYLRFTEPTV